MYKLDLAGKNLSISNRDRGGMLPKSWTGSNWNGGGVEEGQEDLGRHEKERGRVARDARHEVRSVDRGQPRWTNGRDSERRAGESLQCSRENEKTLIAPHHVGRHNRRNMFYWFVFRCAHKKL